jgi:hypothetical protein
MADKIKFTDEELTETSTLRDKMAEIFGELGQLTISRHLLNEQLAVVIQKEEEALKTYKDLAKQEEDLVTKLTNKYGVGSLDLNTGEFTPEK